MTTIQTAPVRPTRARPRADEFETLRQINEQASHHYEQAMHLYAERDELARNLARRGATIASLARACGTTGQAMGFAIGRWTRTRSKQR